MALNSCLMKDMKSKFNRVIAMFVTVLLFSALLVVPAFADETDDAFIDLLDYGYDTVSGTNNVSISYGSGSATYNLPYRMSTKYIDVLFTFYDAYEVTGVEVLHSNGTSLGSLSIVHVDGSVFRAYGQISGTYSTNLSLNFTTTTTQFGASNLTILRFLVSPLDITHVPIEGSCIINNGDYTETINYRPTDKSNSRTFTWDTNSPIFLTLIPGEWLAYDYIDFNIEVYNTVSITSVAAMLDRQPLPVEVSYLNNGSADYEFNSITIRVDLRNADRTADGEVEIMPMIYLNAVPASGSGYVNVYGISAYVVIDEPSPLTYWLTKVQSSLHSIGVRINTFMTNTGSWFTDLGSNISDGLSSLGDRIVSALSPEGDIGQMQDDADKLKDEMQGAIDSMGELERPDIDNVFTDVELDIGEGSAFANLMGMFFDNELIYSVVFASLTFTLFGVIVG